MEIYDDDLSGFEADGAAPLPPAHDQGYIELGWRATRTNAGLTGEYQIVLHPTLLGSGQPLFDDIHARHDLELEGVRPYPSRTGLEDTTVRSDGRPAVDNTDLVRVATAMIRRQREMTGELT